MASGADIGIPRTEDISRLVVLYQENARLAGAFWEWQHKVITLFTSGVGAILAIESWIFTHNLGRWLAVPAGAGCLLSLVCVVFAYRNKLILNAAYKTGLELEKHLGSGLNLAESLPYTWLTNSKPIYRRYLTPLFAVGAIGFLVLMILIIAWHSPSHHH